MPVIGQMFSPGFLSAWQDEARRRDALAQSGTEANMRQQELRSRIALSNAEAQNAFTLNQMRMKAEEGARADQMGLARDEMGLSREKMGLEREKFGLEGQLKRQEMGDKLKGYTLKEQEMEELKRQFGITAGLKERELEEVKILNAQTRKAGEENRSSLAKQEAESKWAHRQNQATRWVDMSQDERMRTALSIHTQAFYEGLKRAESTQDLMRLGIDLARLRANPMDPGQRTLDPNARGEAFQQLMATMQNHIKEKIGDLRNAGVQVDDAALMSAIQTEAGEIGKRSPGAGNVPSAPGAPARPGTGAPPPSYPQPAPVVAAPAGGAQDITGGINTLGQQMQEMAERERQLRGGGAPPGAAPGAPPAAAPSPPLAAAPPGAAPPPAAAAPPPPPAATNPFVAPPTPTPAPTPKKKEPDKKEPEKKPSGKKQSDKEPIPRDKEGFFDIDIRTGKPKPKPKRYRDEEGFWHDEDIKTQNTYFGSSVFDRKPAKYSKEAPRRKALPVMPPFMRGIESTADLDRILKMIDELRNRNFQISSPLSGR